MDHLWLLSDMKDCKVADDNTHKCMIQSTLDISKLKLVSNYRYHKVNILVPENLLYNISSLRKQELKCEEK